MKSLRLIILWLAAVYAERGYTQIATIDSAVIEFRNIPISGTRSWWSYGGGGQEPYNSLWQLKDPQHNIRTSNDTIFVGGLWVLTLDTSTNKLKTVHYYYHYETTSLKSEHTLIVSLQDIPIVRTPTGASAVYTGDFSSHFTKLYGYDYLQGSGQSYSEYEWNLSTRFRDSSLFKITFYGELKLGIEEQPILTSAKGTVFPNPANRSLAISLDELQGTQTILISDCLGRHIMEYEAVFYDGQTSIDISFIPNGLYYVSIPGKILELLVVRH